jgi:hypothetical protein
MYPIFFMIINVIFLNLSLTTVNVGFMIIDVNFDILDRLFVSILLRFCFFGIMNFFNEEAFLKIWHLLIG